MAELVEDPDGAPRPQGESMEALPAWRDLSHTIEYDPRWPDGKPNYCLACDELLGEGDEMCGHNRALADLATQAAERATHGCIGNHVAPPPDFETWRAARTGGM